MEEMLHLRLNGMVEITILIGIVDQILTVLTKVMDILKMMMTLHLNMDWTGMTYLTGKV